jgi:PAS domain S-box-containing protein
MKPEQPDNEPQRLAYLRALNILDTEREQRFDDIAYLAMSLCGTPMAVVSLIDRDRQWFKSCFGIAGRETSRDIAFCSHAILHPDELLIVEDATLDPRFSDNPLVTGAEHIRFYAGAPIVTDEGYALGTLCVIDREPRQLSELQISSLKVLARQVVQLLQQHQANQALRLSQQKLVTLYNQAPVAIVMGCVDTGRFVEYNPEFVKMLGYTPEELSRLTYSDITPTSYATLDQHHLQDVLKTGRYGPYEKQYIHKDGHLIPVLLNGTLIETADGARLLSSFIQDISERKHAEQIKDDFVSAVSHELRTPLTSISGALGLLVNGAVNSQPEKMHKMLVIAHKNALRLTQMINDLLDMEKLIAGKMGFELKQQPLLPIIEQSLEANKAYADSFGVSLDLQMDTHEQTPLMVFVDGHRLQQVMANLISNAVKFSPAQGQVEVKVIRQAGEVKIAVVDHGPGISDEFRQRLFQKFAQADASTSRQRGGTGLGLAISKTFVERMQGRIGVESEPGQGATFFAIFPLVNTQAEAPAAPARQTH